MSEVEQELILFFKLYILSRHNSYINYMKQARELARWFITDNINKVDIRTDAPIICGGCFSILGKSIGGTLTISCPNCQNSSNMGYEIQQFCDILHLNWYICIYLFCKAIEDIYKCNNQIVFQALNQRYERKPMNYA